MRKEAIEKLIEEGIDRRVTKELNGHLDTKIQMHELTTRMFRLQELGFEGWSDCERPTTKGKDKYQTIPITYIAIDMLLPYFDSVIEKLENDVK